MGCDIHICVEHIGLNKKGQNCWREHNIKIPINRDYALFTFLANVRHIAGVPILDSPRGLPEDCSEEVRALSDDYGLGGHSHSYLYYNELLAVDQNEKIDYDRNTGQNTIGEAFDYFFRWLQEDCLTYSRDPDKTRIVFWFDS